MSSTARDSVEVTYKVGVDDRGMVHHRQPPVLRELRQCPCELRRRQDDVNNSRSRHCGPLTWARLATMSICTSARRLYSLYGQAPRTLPPHRASTVICCSVWICCTTPTNFRRNSCTHGAPDVGPPACPLPNGSFSPEPCDCVPSSPMPSAPAIQADMRNAYTCDSPAIVAALRSRTALRPDCGGNIMTINDAADPEVRHADQSKIATKKGRNAPMVTSVQRRHATGQPMPGLDTVGKWPSIHE